ncbi:uncharacterized protein LOC113323626 [Papaver somniferum]|uniref:uncharacterized protein LOC113323611 n=1 Tax=Papaver somniferum TaxID=3469 RepID=UPI000E7057A6|nr:uncharacterized protein LOC113323611 [Papaver somniferum]XP_026427730.1 uncharacterized protein LOC113323626 [Papaver somniferum]
MATMIARKSSHLIFRSLTTTTTMSPLKHPSSSCSPWFLSSSSSKEKPQAYHRSEDDEPSIRSRLPPREKGSRDDHRINVQKSKTIPGRHVVTLTFKPFAR